MKIKLRDLSKEQYEKWFRDYCGKTICKECSFNSVYCYADENGCWVYHKNLFSDKFLNQEIEIEDEPILDAKEKEYLEAVLKPFKESVKKIRKVDIGDFEEIIIVLRGVIFDNEAFSLPWFKKGTMYKDMEYRREYTLQELGLFEDGE